MKDNKTKPETPIANKDSIKNIKILIEDKAALPLNIIKKKIFNTEYFEIFIKK